MGFLRVEQKPKLYHGSGSRQKFRLLVAPIPQDWYAGLGRVLHTFDPIEQKGGIVKIGGVYIGKYPPRNINQYHLGVKYEKAERKKRGKFEGKKRRKTKGNGEIAVKRVK